MDHDDLKLDAYKDYGFNTITWFYKDSSDRMVSPFFDSIKEAEEWLTKEKENL